MAVLAEPIVLAPSTPLVAELLDAPIATFPSPVVLLVSALRPTAVFGPLSEEDPAVFVKSAKEPTAVFPPSVVLFTSASVPTAVLLVPVLLSNNAAAPTAVL